MASASTDFPFPTGPVLVLNPDAIAETLKQRREWGGDFLDEVWDGVYVMSPDPSPIHQTLAMGLVLIFCETQEPRGATVFPSVNVTDRERGWQKNFRIPDASLYLQNPVKDLGPVLLGGPDFLVEVISPKDKSREKFEFYAGIGVRECLLVHPKTKQCELYREREGAFHLVARSTAKQPATCASEVLGLSFQVAGNKENPLLMVQSLKKPRKVWKLYSARLLRVTQTGRFSNRIKPAIFAS